MSIPITVVLINHKRKEYVIEALDSVLTQTLNHDLYEIILVSNEQVIPREEQGRVNVLVTEMQQYSDKVGIALDSSNGEIIVLLDDDDIFYSNKLEKIYGLFESDKQIGYLHNNYDVIDSNGVQLSVPFRSYDFRDEGKRLSLSIKNTKEIHKFIHRGIDFNHSCISFRRQILQGWRNKIQSLPGSFDTFVFLASLCAGYEVMIDSEKLTRYRLHSHSKSQANGDLMKLRDWLNKRIINYSSMLDIMKECGNDEILVLIENKLFDSLIVRDILDDKPRKLIFTDTLQFLKNSKSLGFYQLSKTAIALLNFLSNPLAMKVYFSKVL